nr:MucBP domain-containing protein [Lacticaseibacillus nasuensis]
MKAGDVATIFVPDALSGLQADDKAQQLHVVMTKTTQNGLSGTLFTFTAAEDGVMGPTFSFRKLTAPTDLLTAHTESYPVTLAINGEQQATLNYQNVVKIAHKHDTTTQQTVTVPAKQSALTLDQNQRGHANLVTNQQYVYGVGLTNEDHAAPLYLGAGENVNASGSITVPAGFVLDGSGLVAEDNRAVGGGMATLAGDENAPRTDDQLLTQTGTTLTLTNVALPVNQNWNAITTLMFWGHYTQPLSAEANQFTVDLTYAQKQAERATTVTQPDGSTTTTHYLVQLMPTTVTAAIAKPVATTPVATSSFGTAAVMDVMVAGQPVTAVYKDGLDANQTMASQDKDRINQPASGQLDAGYLNTGNIAQQNATLTFDYHGVKAVQFTLTAGDFAKLTSLTATYTDGTTVTSAPGQAYLGLDGTKGVATIVAKYATIPAGQKLAAVLTSNGWADTPQAPGTSFDYSVSYVSDQQPTALTKAIPVLVLPYTEKAYGVDVDGWSNSNGKLVHIGADVSAGVVLNPAYAGKIGRYAFTVPNNFAFDLASSTVTFTENGQDTSAPLVKYTTLLGPVGPNGELVYTLDFSDVVASKGVVNLALTVKQDALPGKMNFSDWFVQYDDPTYTADFITRHQATIGGQAVTLSGTALPLTPEILIPGLFENRNGIDDRMTPDVTYLRYDAANGAATTAHFLKAPTSSATASLDTSTMRLVTINSFTEASPWTQNLVVLPRKANGDAFDLVLADAGSITSDSTDTGELLYATTVPTIGDGQLVLTDFVPAEQINDWSQVRSVILTTGQLGANTAVAAILPIQVTGITGADDGATVTFASTFKGVDRTGNVATNVQTMAATVIAAQTVTVRYVAQADDGTQTDIIQPQTTEYHVGDDYTTSALPTNLIPAGYALVATPANASGVVGDAPITVTYVYANPQAPVTTTQTKVVHQTIVYQFADHTTAAPSQTDTVTFTRSVTRSSNGGAVISTTLGSQRPPLLPPSHPQPWPGISLTWPRCRR